MSTPVHEFPQPALGPHNATSPSSDEDGTYVGESSLEDAPNRLIIPTQYIPAEHYPSALSPSQTREQEHRLDDDLAVLQAEQVASNVQTSDGGRKLTKSTSIRRSRSRRSEPVDEFDIATNPLHEKTAGYRPPDHPSTNFAKFFKRIHNSSVLIRYFTYIVPVVVLLLIPLLLGALVFKNASVGGVSLSWFAVWLLTVFLTLFAGRIVAKCIPWPMGLVSSLFTNNSKKWKDMGTQLEVPATIFFWWLGIEISFLPTMTNHHTDGNNGIKPWEATMNKIIVSIFVGTTLNLVEKIIIQLIAISFHLRTYSDRIVINKFQIASLTKLYRYSKQKIAMDDSEFEEDGPSIPASGARTPAQYLDKAHKNAREALNAVTDVAGKVAMDFTGKPVVKSTHPHQVVLTLLNTTKGSQVLARRLYRTFVREGEETVSSDDLKNAFDDNEEADAAFAMFDKDLNGDISMEELEAVCVEIGRERKSITASLKDLDSVVAKLDTVFVFIVTVIVILVFLSLISASTAGVLTSAGSTLLALSWLFSATAQEFLQSVIFVFVKHPFDVGDRVSIYGNTGATGKGDDYFVKEIALLYTEFKKLEGHVVQAPNSYLNTLFILNMRRSGGLAEAIPMIFKYGTTLDQIDQLRQRLLEFVKVEKREYQGNILTEIREIEEAHSITVNVVFFYKSNWQNELLRLQRRNKFICAMMVTMQEIGIEGPRMRLPGQTQTSPYYLRHVTPEAPAGGSGAENGPGPRSGSLARDAPFVPNAADESATGRHPSILRHAPSTSRATRARGESLSAMSRRVDFSLGMKDVSSSDIYSDVYDDRSISRLPDFKRPSATNSDQNKRASEETDSLSKTTSRDAESRYSLDSQNQNRVRPSHSAIHRNRFFGRNRGASKAGTDQELMEQGMADIPEIAEGSKGSKHIDPRTGTVSPTAVRSNTNASTSSIPARAGSSKGLGKLLQRSRTDDFEMRGIRK